MGLAFPIARRSLLQRRGRTVFSILGIALGIATVVGVVTLDHSTVRGLALARKLEGAPDLEVRPARDAEDASDELAGLEGIARVSPFFQNDVTVRPLDAQPEDGGRARRGGAVSRARMFALDARALAGLGVHRVLEGRDLGDPASREVLLGQELAQEAGVGLGERVVVSRPRRVGRRSCVDGVVETVETGVEDAPTELDFLVVGILAPEKLGRRSRGAVVVLDYGWGRALFEGAHVATRYWVKRDPAVNIERLEAALGRKYSFSVDKSVVTGELADERAFRTGVRMAGLLALVLGLYVIFHTLSMSLTERIGEVGTLHSLGATRFQISRVFMWEALVLAGCGAAFGLGGGVLLAFGLMRAGVTTLGSGKYIGHFEVPWGMVLPLAGVGFGIAMIGAVYPLARLGGANVAAILRGEEVLRARSLTRGFHLLAALLLAIVLPGLYFVLVPVVGEFTAPLAAVLSSALALLGLLVVLPLVLPALLARLCASLASPFARLWPLAGRLAARNMAASPARVAVSASALALVAAGLVGLKGMTASLAGEVEVWGREAVRDKVWVRGLPPVPFDELAAHLHGFPGVVAVENASARAWGSFLLVGTDVRELAAWGPCATDPAVAEALERGEGLIVSRRLAEDRGLSVGDVLPIGSGDEATRELQIVAVSDAYGYVPHPDERMYGVVSDDVLHRTFCLDVGSVTEVVVRVDDDADPGLVEASVRDYLAGRGAPDDGARLEAAHVRYESGAELLAAHVDDIAQDFVLFDVLIALTAALAALGVLNGQLLAALERSKEIGVLKALGVERRQVAGMVCLEAAVVGLVGGALGVALGLGATPLVVGAIEDLAGLALPLRGAGGWAVAAFLGGVGLALLAGLYPIWRMNRFDAVRAVRTG